MVSPAVCTAHCLRHSDVTSVSSSDNDIVNQVPSAGGFTSCVGDQEVM